jgi:hypothetical protein
MAAVDKPKESKDVQGKAPAPVIESSAETGNIRKEQDNAGESNSDTFSKNNRKEEVFYYFLSFLH